MMLNPYPFIYKRLVIIPQIMLKKITILLKMERYGMNHLERQRIKTGKKVNLSSMFKIFTTLMKVNYILIRNILKVH